MLPARYDDDDDDDSATGPVTYFGYGCPTHVMSSTGIAWWSSSLSKSSTGLYSEFSFSLRVAIPS